MSKREAIESSVAGAQTVERACALLQEIARAGGGQARILDLCSATGLARPTAHRILRSLVAAGFVRQEQGSRRYGLGFTLFELGLAAPSPVESFPEVRQAVDELADATGDTVYLMLRSGDEVVCAWRGVGAYPIRANVVSAGDRRPMGASGAGVALLGALPPSEAEGILRRSRHRLQEKCRYSHGQLLAEIARTRATGYSFGKDLVMEGVTAVGMAVPSRLGSPWMAISVSGIDARVGTRRLPGLLPMLRETAARISRIASAAPA